MDKTVTFSKTEKLELKGGDAAKLYGKRETERQPFLDRAEECARLTIQSMVSTYDCSTTDTAYNDEPTPSQAAGSEAVLNLSSKLLMALFPPRPFFAHQADRFALEKAANEQGVSVDQVKIDFEAQLGVVDRSIMEEFSARSSRIKLHDGLQHLLVSGNFVHYMPEKQDDRIFYLSSYTLRRDGQDNWYDLIIKEKVHYSVLPARLQQLGTEQGDDEGMVDVYTRIHRNRGSKNWVQYQEVAEEIFNLSKFTEEENPWIVPRSIYQSGEHYNRSIVEQYFGDFQSLEVLWGSMLDTSQAIARLIMLVDPASPLAVKVNELAKAPNGAFVKAKQGEIAALDIGKTRDLGAISSVAEKVERRLSRAFLMVSAIQRNAERVTAEEIRILAQELEQTRAGLYTILTQDLQMPVVRRLKAIMTKEKRLPALPKELVKPVIVTGLQAIGRGNDINDLMTASSTAGAFLNNLGQAAGLFEIKSVVKAIFTAAGVDTVDLMKTEEKLQQEQQAAAAQQQAQLQASLLEKTAPEVVKQAGAEAPPSE